jgi:Uma2 family endonuclease
MSANPRYPQRHLITAAEYLRMTEAGVFAPDSRLELMEGEIIDMAPIGSRHAAVVNTLAALLSRLAGNRAIVSVQNPLIVGEKSVPQPDLMLLKTRADRYFDAHPTAADVLLVVEVSDSTLRFDLDTKIPLYARAGIADAWLINLDKRTLTSFSDRTADGYRASRAFSCAEKIAVPAFPQESISIGALFPA